MTEQPTGLKANFNFNEAVDANTDFLEMLRDKLPEYFTSEDDFDFPKFQAALKENNVSDELTSGYRLDFIGKNLAKKQSGERPTTVIVPDKAHNNKPENKDSKNLFFTGDNLEVLRHLQSNYQNAVDFIYIDPPYNTGSDGFVYPDDFKYSDEQLKAVFALDDEGVKRLKSIQGRSSHSAWLAFMYPRLYLARKLLKETGVIFVSIDNNEQANLKLLMDEIFGEGSFVTSVLVQMSTTQGMKVGSAKKGNIVKNGEYVLAYSKSGEKAIAKNLLYDFRPDYDEHYNSFLKSDGMIISLKDFYDYSFPKDLNNTKPLKLAEAFEKSDEFAEIVRTHLAEIVADDKISGDDLTDGLENGKWKEVEKNNRKYLLTLNSKGKMRQLLTLGSSWGKTDGYKGSEGLRKIRGDWWDGFYIDMGNVAKEDGIEYKNGKKPIRLVKQLIKWSGVTNGIIMDFFAGSGTTASAVMNDNKENGSNNSYILVQLPENLDERLETADTEGKKQTKALIKMLDEKNRPHFLDQMTQQRIINAQVNTEDKSGFKHYTVKEVEVNTLDKMIDFNPDLLLVEDLVAEIDGGAETLLVTWLTADGYKFDEKVELVKFDEHAAYYVDSSLLYIIEKGWSAKATEELVNALGTRKLNVNTIIVSEYALGFSDMTELKTNVKNINEPKVRVEVRG